MAFSLVSSLLVCLVSLFAFVASRGVHAARFSTPSPSTYLNAHNAIRSVHGAQPLTWSESLTDDARAWASECTFRSTDGALREGQYGEIIGAATGSFLVNAFLKTIATDAANWDPANPTFTGFTQVVWKDTTQVGCAMNRCTGLFPDHPSDVATLYVCFYDPAGNIRGEGNQNVQP